MWFPYNNLLVENKFRDLDEKWKMNCVTVKQNVQHTHKKQGSKQMNGEIWALQNEFKLNCQLALVYIRINGIFAEKKNMKQ